MHFARQSLLLIDRENLFYNSGFVNPQCTQTVEGGMTTMNEKMYSQLDDYLSGMLTPAGWKEFDRHLELCQSCR